MLFRGVSYVNVYQAIGVGLVLAVLAYLMELMILKESSFWLSTIADFMAAFAVVYISQFFLRNVIITFTGALFAAVLLSITEYFQHTYLISTGKTKKS